jgi:hypothetical protein
MRACVRSSASTASLKSRSQLRALAFSVRFLICLGEYRRLIRCAEETRIRWVQTQHASDALYQRIMHTLSEGRHIAEEKLNQILAILTGKTAEATNYADEKANAAGAWASEKTREAEAAAARAKSEL